MPFLIDQSIVERVERIELPFNRYGIDPYGIAKRDLAVFYTWLDKAYRSYFHCEVHGIEHIPVRGRAMIIGNHSGGVAIDAAMVLASCFFELSTPRLAQGMAEKFIQKLPGASQIASRIGQFTGLPEHAKRLLDEERLLMVFPEGARGTAKLAHEADSLVRFGTGFMRLAMETGTPIIPLAFVGGGEAMPTVANLYGLGKLLGVPYVPVTRYLVPFPRPTTFQLLYGAPMRFEGDGSEADEVIQTNVEKVRTRIAWLIEQGRKLREGKLRADELELT
ncbi:MAG: acyltransferase family protein [Polyangiaceae bacterium]|nr:acyltransferase family protein [Polyangiaceae bacterium]